MLTHIVHSPASHKNTHQPYKHTHAPPKKTSIDGQRERWTAKEAKREEGKRQSKHDRKKRIHPPLSPLFFSLSPAPCSLLSLTLLSLSFSLSLHCHPPPHCTPLHLRTWKVSLTPFPFSLHPLRPSPSLPSLLPSPYPPRSIYPFVPVFAWPTALRLWSFLTTRRSTGSMGPSKTSYCA